MGFAHALLSGVQRIRHNSHKIFVSQNTILLKSWPARFTRIMFGFICYYNSGYIFVFQMWKKEDISSLFQT